VDRIALTLNGWRADNVRYYSMHPDDLEPLFRSERVFFSARNSHAPEADSNDWNVDVWAEGVEMNPSVAWGVEVPPESNCRQVDRLELSLGFRSDRVILSNGKMRWLGSNFSVGGIILKGERKEKKEAPAKGAGAILPVFVDAHRFHALEEHLAALSLPDGATVDIDFLVDMADYSKSHVAFALKAKHLGVCGVAFSEAEISGNYAYPVLRIDRAGVSMDGNSCQVKGTYSFDSKLVEGVFSNTLENRRILNLLPDAVSETMARVGVRVDEPPQFNIAFDPAPIKELANHLSGTFSVRNVAYKDLEIESLRGRVARRNNRIDFTGLDGVAAGQEERATPGGTALHGGFAKGSVFWDGNRREFGVDVDASLDPNILVGVLSPIRVATNIIERFVFSDQPPRGHVSVGATLSEKDTFYINIKAKGTNVAFQGVTFDTIGVTQTYKHGKVKLDSLAATQGTNASQGSILIDLRKKAVTFDLSTGLNPADIAKLAYPKFTLFDRYILMGGDISIDAKGIFDWGSMQQTDLQAKIRAERVKMPFVELDDFVADIYGEGPTIKMENANFGLFGGSGQGGLALSWNPGKSPLPYETDITFSKVDFHRLLAFLGAKKTSTISGQLSGNTFFEGDFSSNFYATARGEGFVRVEDGQLTDLPLFHGFSRAIRKVIPSFTVFTITSLRGNFSMAHGAVSFPDAYFGGDLVSAKGKGSYDFEKGFNAIMQVQMLNESRISKVVRVITDPLLKLFEIRLTGTLTNPSWKLEKF
jgi:hypothetical protein